MIEPAISKKIELQVREIIEEVIDNRDMVNGLLPDEDLFSGATGMDSVDMVSIIVLIERRFNIAFSQEADFAGIFRNIDSIVDAILRLNTTRDASC